MARHIVYHSDLDGECAGAIAYKYYTEEGDKDINLISMHYAKEFPMQDIKSDDYVDILDFSLQKTGEFKELLDITKNVVWIDHHKTAIDTFKGLELDGIQSIEKSGCELAWDYYMGGNAPLIVKYIGDFDMWKFVYGKETDMVFEALKTYDTRPQSKMWDKWFDNIKLTNLKRTGESCVAYRNSSNKLLASTSFKFLWNGYKCIGCNCHFTGSQVFDSVKDIKEYELLVTFGFNGVIWNVSLYAGNDIVDCGNIAKTYGGGGHKGAAGFQVNELPKEFRSGV
jgi:uncharacterized protein